MKGDRVVTEGFHARVFEVVRQVPAGRVTTYGDVAGALGASSVARHVGWALSAVRDADVPWHRVLNARGKIAGGPGLDPNGREALQRSLLEQEGVRFDSQGRVNLRKYRHTFEL
jgi:methylated-DNA-protein-cysteine methyltransferase-like protein